MERILCCQKNDISHKTIRRDKKYSEILRAGGTINPNLKSHNPLRNVYMQRRNRWVITAHVRKTECYFIATGG